MRIDSHCRATATCAVGWLALLLLAFGEPTTVSLTESFGHCETEHGTVESGLHGPVAESTDQAEQATGCIQQTMAGSLCSCPMLVGLSKGSIAPRIEISHRPNLCGRSQTVMPISANAVPSAPSRSRAPPSTS